MAKLIHPPTHIHTAIIYMFSWIFMLKIHKHDVELVTKYGMQILFVFLFVLFNPNVCNKFPVLRTIHSMHECLSVYDWILLL